MLALLSEELPGNLAAVEEEMLELRGQIEIRELRFSKLAAARARFEDVETGEEDNINWIRHNCRMTQQAAADRVRVGEQLENMERSEFAFYNGAIGFQHLAVMARTAAAVGDAFDENQLLPLAAKYSPGKFYHLSLRYRHTVRPKEVAEEQRGQAENNSLKLVTGEDGTLLVNGWFDNVTGAAIRSALEPLAKPTGKHDDRIRDKRMADAFAEIITHNQQVHMQVTASLETLLGLLGAPGAENEFSLPISSKTAERWACDSTLSRVLLQDSIPIDVGRASRVIKGARRRALIARDRHCRWPQCERPASWCDGHR